jgi:ABC-2 type transport system ATP-binding protein
MALLDTPLSFRAVERGNVVRNNLVVEMHALTKIYPPSTKAVDSLDLGIYEGEIFGLLGPNGAGKSTTIKMLLTLIPPTSGSIIVNGMDPRNQQTQVRRVVGYVPQEVSVDGDLTGFENLLISAKLYGVKDPERSSRISLLLKQFNLESRANELVKRYSGGMMRKLEIAQALVSQPRILFMDEPTIGLDPVAKREVWRQILELRMTMGMTVFLSTHDMGEADFLCDRIAIMNAGRIVIVGEPGKLKQAVGGTVVRLRLRSRTDAGDKSQVVGLKVQQSIRLPSDLNAKVINESHSESEGREISIAFDKWSDDALPSIIRYFEGCGEEVLAVNASTPGLDDVFLKYAGLRLEEAEKRPTAGRRSFRSHAR